MMFICLHWLDMVVWWRATTAAGPGQFRSSSPRATRRRWRPSRSMRAANCPPDWSGAL